MNEHFTLKCPCCGEHQPMRPSLSALYRDHHPAPPICNACRASIANLTIDKPRYRLDECCRAIKESRREAHS